MDGTTGNLITYDMYKIGVNYESRVDPSKTEKDFWEDFFKYGLKAYNSRKKNWNNDFVNDDDDFKDLVVSVVLQLKAMHIDKSKRDKIKELT